jgi:precorrin-3B synthase
MNTPHRRGACPGLSAPMATGDGLLVRFTAENSISLDAFIALAAAARRYGNGTIEVSARGSLQVRGLSPRSAPAFARALHALDIPAADGTNVIADPLPDDPDVVIDTTGLAGTLRRALAAARLALAPKVCVTLDGGGHLHLDELSADLRLRAIGPAQAPRLHISVGGDATSATPLGLIPPRAAADLGVALLGAIALHGADARAVDVLRNRGSEPFRAALDDIETAPVLPPRPPAEPVGRHPLRDGAVALGVALAFGHAHADALSRLACVAGAYGARAVRPAPYRSLLLLGIARENVDNVAEKIEREGFIVRADDRRRRVVACPGKPACASGLIAARALAGEIAQRLPPSQGIVHISGCAKGCAHPAPAALTVVGTQRGCGIIAHGSARGVPRCHVDDADIVSEVARLASETLEAMHV